MCSMKNIFILLSILLFVVTGCSDENNTSKSNSSEAGDNSSVSVPDVPVNELQGTYKVTFFGSEIKEHNDYYVTNDCKKAEELFSDIVNKNGKNKCSGENEIKLLESDNSSKAVIYIRQDNNKKYVVINIQADDGIGNNYLTYKYQYIRTNSFDALSGRGFKEYFYDETLDNVSEDPAEFSEDTFHIEMIDGNKLKLSFNYTDKRIALSNGSSINADTKNTFILEKIGDDTRELLIKYE